MTNFGLPCSLFMNVTRHIAFFKLNSFKNCYLLDLHKKLQVAFKYNINLKFCYNLFCGYADNKYTHRLSAKNVIIGFKGLQNVINP